MLITFIVFLNNNTINNCIFNLRLKDSHTTRRRRTGGKRGPAGPSVSLRTANVSRLVYMYCVLLSCCPSRSTIEWFNTIVVDTPSSPKVLTLLPHPRRLSMAGVLVEATLINCTSIGRTNESLGRARQRRPTDIHKAYQTSLSSEVHVSGGDRTHIPRFGIQRPRPPRLIIWMYTKYYLFFMYCPNFRQVWGFYCNHRCTCCTCCYRRSV